MNKNVMMTADLWTLRFIQKTLRDAGYQTVWSYEPIPQEDGTYAGNLEIEEKAE